MISDQFDTWRKKTEKTGILGILFHAQGGHPLLHFHFFCFNQKLISHRFEFERTSSEEISVVLKLGDE